MLSCAVLRKRWSRWLPGILLVPASLGCDSSSISCNSKGCLQPITITALVSGAANGTYSATFCKHGACPTISLGLPGPSSGEVKGDMDLELAVSPTDAGAVRLTAVVYSASSFTDGETLRLTLRDSSGNSVLDWSAPANYTHTTFGEPACGECVSFQAEIRSP
jgi:hypothetical protein